MVLLKIFIFFTLFAVIHASNHDPPLCSTNASSAYVDMILLIDTSTNMGSANLKKIATTMSLVMPKFPIGNQADITEGYRNTRVSVVTFDTKAMIVANFTDVNNINDLSRILNNIQVSNSLESNLVDALDKASYIKTNCTNPDDCVEEIAYVRPTAIVLFAASANTPDISKIPELVTADDFLETGTLITVNFNSSNPTLTILLNNITYNKVANASMYNYVSTSNTLTKNLEWALLQANCYCEEGLQPIFYDTNNNRYAKYAACIHPIYDQGENFLHSTLEMCQFGSVLPTIPASILNVDYQNLLEAMFTGNNPFTGQSLYPYYFGLHKNLAGVWSWYDYDQSEFPLSGFTKWGQGEQEIAQSWILLMV